MFEPGQFLKYIPEDSTVIVEGVDIDFIVVVDWEGESHVVVKEDFDKYEVAE